MPEHHLQHHIISGFIRVVTDIQTYIPAFWAHPVHGGPFPGIVVLHDDWGLQAVARTTAHRLAEAGYYVIVPDLFEGNRASNQLEADALEARYKDSSESKVNAGLEALRTHPKCNRKMAVLGWDLGADIAMQLALDHDDIMAAVALSGDPSPLFGKFDELRCPLLAIFGGQDPLSMHAKRLEQELQQSDNRHRVIVYPEAQHAFYNHLAEQDYNHKIAERAFAELLFFLEEHQGKPPAPSSMGLGSFYHGRVY
ncbi:MAG: hypothetical protein CUN55_12910 [Phototrophicales bacterium]|nr:MAG: hypothetical protein CUN55_12910 [Phototrophicales bacterium]